MIIVLVIKVDHCRYHETTQSLNFAIFLMATWPEAEKKGLNSRMMYRTNIGMLDVSDYSSALSAKKIVPKMPTSVNTSMMISNPRIDSFRMQKASTQTMMGERLLTIEMIVSGMYLVTE